MTSEGGRGTLTIRDVKEADQGAYTCEAMNARGMVFGIPDGVLELIPQRGMASRWWAGGHPAWGGAGAACWLVTSYSPLPCCPAGPCPDGHFYLEHSAACLSCFCFGVTSVCQSSHRFREQIRLRFDQPNDFKGTLVGGRQWGGGGHQVPVGLKRRHFQESSMYWVDETTFREGHKIAEGMLRRKSFQGKTSVFRKSQIHT